MQNKNQNNFTVKALLRPYSGRVIWLCILTVLHAVLQVSATVLTRDVIDAAIAQPEKLLQSGILLIANLLAVVAAHVLHNWYAGTAYDKAAAGMRHSLLESALGSSEGRLQAFHSGSLLSRGIEDVNTVCDGVINVLPNMVGMVMRLVASFAAVLLLYSPVAGAIAVVALVVAAVAAVIRPILRKHHKIVRGKEEQVMSYMQENLQQLELMQSLGAEGQSLDRFDQRLKASLRAKFDRRRWVVSVNTVISAVTQLSTGVLLLWGVSRIAAGDLTYGALTAMLQLLSLLRAPVVGLSGQWTRLAAVEVAAQRLSDMLIQPQKKQAPVTPENITAVVFEDVTFAYPGDETPVVENFSAEFPLSNWTCLVGMSGKGKTTLFKLMLGLYKPTSGSVFLRTDGGDVPCGAQTRHLFAYVPQDYALLSGTILENLLLVAPDATREQRERALRLAAADFVWELTAFEQTPVKENNAGLSKGQLQRLAVARAILMDRPIFLLDECTSALDAQTENILLQNLNTLGKRGILVTHRPEAAQNLSRLNMISMERENG